MLGAFRAVVVDKDVLTLDRNELLDGRANDRWEERGVGWMPYFRRKEVCDQFVHRMLRHGELHRVGGKHSLKQGLRLLAVASLRDDLLVVERDDRQVHPRRGSV